MQKELLFKNDVLTLQMGVLGMLNPGLLHKCTGAMSDKTVGATWQVLQTVNSFWVKEVF